MSAKEGTPDEGKLRAVQEVLRELPQREGQPCMVPFGPVAFFPGQLVDTHTVYVERSTSAAASKPAGPAVGGGQLEELTPAQAAERLQALLHARSDQRQQLRHVAQRQQQPLAPRPPAQQAPAQPRAPQQQAADAASRQQLASLVGGQSPDNLKALHRALQQLGAALDEQAVASGQLPSAEGKEVVDIREEYNEAVHGPLEETSADRAQRSAGQQAAPSSSGAQRAVPSSSGGRDQAAASSSGAAQQAAKPAAASAAQQGSDGGGSPQQEASRQQRPEQAAVAAAFAAAVRDSESVDSFEDLMQRMEELEMAELAAEDWQPAAAAAPAAAAPAAAAQQQGAGGGGSSARPPSGFKPGFLLGKQLEPEQPSSAAPSHQQQQQQQQQLGAGEAAAARQRRQRDEEAARRQEAAFTGAVVERQPASAALLSAPVQERQPGLPAQPEPLALQPGQQQQAQRVSKFRQRRQGLDE